MNNSTSEKNDLQNFAIGTNGTIDDSLWVLQTTAVIENAGTMNKAVLEWQARDTADKTKANFITDFNKAHKKYLSLLKLTSTPIAHNAQEMNAEIDELRGMVNDTRTVVNQVVEVQNNTRDDTSIASTRSNVPTTVTTQPMLALQQEMAAMRTTFQQELAASRTALAVSEACYNPNPPGRGGGGGRGGRGRDGRGGRGGTGR